MSRTKLSFSADRASNSELFVWALYLLGGAEHDVDVEDIYMKCFDIAPARLGWRTRPKIPDYKKAAKALQSVEAETEFIHKTHQYARRLTSNGLNWVNQNLEKLHSTYGDQNVKPAASNHFFQRSAFIKAHPIWVDFLNGANIDVLHTLADSLECSPASPAQTWNGRFVELETMASVLKDEELKNFLAFARNAYQLEMKRALGE